MVAQFVRLKLTLMANTFRRSVWQTVGVVVGSLYALVIVFLAVGGAIAGGWSDMVVTGQVVVILGSVLVLGWWLVPVFLYGVDATLDPQRFATYGIPRPQLLAGLGVAGVVSVPGLATLLTVLGVALAWLRAPAALVVALVGGVLALALCVVGSRAIVTLLAPLLESRRSREVLAVVAIVPLMLLGPIISGISSRMEGVAAGDGLNLALRDLSGLLGWTPVGAPWGMATAVHDGDWGAALLRLLVVLASLAVAVWAWDLGLRRSLEAPAKGGASGAKAKGLGLFGRLPATPVGAVAARAATYYVRDPRYAISLITVPLLPVVLVFATHGAGAEGDHVLLMLAPLVAWILGFGISNDIAYDHTAFALHLATGVTGKVDRWGRALPVLTAGSVVVVVFALLTCGIAGRWEWLPPLLGLSLGTLAASTGVSSFVSARWLYPVPKPGESPMKQPQGATGATMLAQSVSMGLAVLVSLPSLALAGLAIFLPNAVLGWVALVAGPAIGVVVLLVGIGWGARTYDRKAPELLQQVLSYV